MKHLKILLMSLVGGLMFTGCISPEEAAEVENVNIKKESELYGAWKYVYQGISGYLGDNTTPYYYVLGKDSSYFIEAGVSEDSSRAVFSVFPLNWDLSNGRKLLFSNNPKYFVYDVWSAESVYDRQPMIFHSSVKGIEGSYVYTVSNLDSIVEAVRQINANNEPIDLYFEVPDSLSLVIIQYGELNGKKRIHTVLESCYQDHAEAQNLKDLCDVNIFEKDDLLDLKGILSQVDTVSSTDIWDDILGVSVYRE